MRIEDWIKRVDTPIIRKFHDVTLEMVDEVDLRDYHHPLDMIFSTLTPVEFYQLVLEELVQRKQIKCGRCGSTEVKKNKEFDRYHGPHWPMVYPTYTCDECNQNMSAGMRFVKDSWMEKIVKKASEEVKSWPRWMKSNELLKAEAEAEKWRKVREAREMEQRPFIGNSS
jgi:ribosomal protein S27AE